MANLHLIVVLLFVAGATKIYGQYNIGYIISSFLNLIEYLHEFQFTQNEILCEKIV